MRRPGLLTILLLLLGGAVVNVGVAWGFAYRRWEGGFLPNATEAEARLLVERYAPHEWPMISPLAAASDRVFGSERSVVIAATDPPTGERQEPLSVYSDRTHGFTVVATGWPAKSLEMGKLIKYAPRGRHSRSGVRFWGVWTLRNDAGHDYLFGKNLRRLPIAPRPYGFIWNSLFYAALLWLVFFGPHTLRRHLRIRRGLCPACTYPVGESSVCTECGRSLSRPRQ